MNRKLYICPTIETVELKTQQLLAVSNLRLYDTVAGENGDGTFGNAPFIEFNDNELTDMILFSGD